MVSLETICYHFLSRSFSAAFFLMMLLHAGDMYVADISLHVIRKVAANGTVTTLVGKAGISGWTPDGPASSAVLSGPWALTLIQNGSALAWTEQGTCVVRKLDLVTMTVTTVAGVPRGCQFGLNVVGPALSARFAPNGLLGIAAYGSSLFLSDTGAP